MGSPVEMGPTRGSSAPVGGSLTAPAAFHVLAKPTGPICNLDCEYCFFLSKEALYPGDRFRMSDELLETLHPPAHRPRARTREVTDRLAGRRADADGRRLLPAGRRAGRAAPPSRPDGAAHHPDQRHAADRRVVRAAGRAPVPRRPQHRRAARAARPLPGRQAGRADLRQGAARGSSCSGPTPWTSTSCARSTPPTRTTRSRSTGTSATSWASATSSSSPSWNGTTTPGSRRATPSPTARSTPRPGGRSSPRSSTSGSCATSGTVFVQIFDAALAAWLDLPPTICIFRRDLRRRPRPGAQRRRLLL